MTTSVSLTVTDPGCGLININHERKISRHERARMVRAWREQTHAAYLDQWQRKGILPVWDGMDAVAYVAYPDRRLHDPVNDCLTAKAIVDELVALGMLHDDSWRYCTGPDMRYAGVVRNVFKAAEVTLVCHPRSTYPAL